jgi:large subunit ribosomal protein L2
MGKRLIQQARGKGSHTYKAPSFRYAGEAKHVKQKESMLKGEVIDIIHCQGHSAPLTKIKYDNGDTALSLAPEGVRIGEELTSGDKISIKPGCTTTLENIPEGTLIYNIESQPGDGGKYVRSSGTFAKILSKTAKEITVMLPSKKTKKFNHSCRASIGIVAGGGRLEKPFLKAGNKYHKMRAKNKLYPHVCGTSMNSVDHPFGGASSHHKGKPSATSRNAPPGRKVGLIGAKRTGRKKK